MQGPLVLLMPSACCVPPISLYHFCCYVITSAGSSIDVAVTSAAGKTANFNNLGTQLAVSPLTECPTSTCTAAAGPRAAATNGSEALPAAATAAAAGTAAAPAPAAAAPVTSGAYRAAVPLGLAVTVLCVVLTVISC